MAKVVIFYKTKLNLLKKIIKSFKKYKAKSKTSSLRKAGSNLPNVK